LSKDWRIAIGGVRNSKLETRKSQRHGAGQQRRISSFDLQSAISNGPIGLEHPRLGFVFSPPDLKDLLASFDRFGRFFRPPARIADIDHCRFERTFVWVNRQLKIPCLTALVPF
jgi:hypothetical protein